MLGCLDNLDTIVAFDAVDTMDSMVTIVAFDAVDTMDSMVTIVAMDSMVTIVAMVTIVFFVVDAMFIKLEIPGFRFESSDSRFENSRFQVSGLFFLKSLYVLISYCFIGMDTIV